MNVKIFNRLAEMLNTSPQLMNNNMLLRHAVAANFDVDIPDLEFTDIADVCNTVDVAVLNRYFSKVWQPKTKSYKYSGLSIIDEVNSLRPRRVFDVGCGYNEFKGKIDNLIGIDPYNPRADICSDIVNYTPAEKADVVICLGSINFGTVDKIYKELQHVVSITNHKGLLFFRVNPGEQHAAPESRWIDFFKWTPGFIINAAEQLDCDILQLRQDGDRYYFVLKRR
jgi:hypothetical protein